eukprot:1772005-Rhodomonas_salina.3
MGLTPGNAQRWYKSARRWYNLCGNAGKAFDLAPVFCFADWMISVTPIYKHRMRCVNSGHAATYDRVWSIRTGHIKTDSGLALHPPVSRRHIAKMNKNKLKKNWSCIAQATPKYSSPSASASDTGHSIAYA